MRISVTVCDVCEEQPAQQYEIRQDERRVQVDLCEAHQQTIEGLMSSGRKVARQRSSTAATRASKPTAKRGRVRRVSSIEEVEAAKQSANG